MNIEKKTRNKIRKTRWAVILWMGLLLSALIGPAAAAEERLATNRTSYKLALDNGMTVLIHEMPGTFSVGLYLLLKTGAVSSDPYLGTGIAHFLEHMVFKGTEKRGVGEIAKEVKSLGGMINATSSLDYTVYFLEVPQDRFAEALDILSDMMMHARIDSQEVEREREVILKEIRLHNDTPERKLSQLVFSTVYLVHPYRHPVIGYEPLFKAITREDLVNYYQSRYIPNNMILSIAGNVKRDEILPQIENVFQGFSGKPYSLRNLPQEPAQISPRRCEEEYPTELTRLSMSYPGVRVLDHDLYALDVLAAILGRGRTSRLFKTIVEKQKLTHTISASNFTPMDKGLFEIEATLDEGKLEEAIRAIKAQIELVKKQKVSVQELEKTKRQVFHNFVLGQQTPGDVAYQAAINEAFVGDYDFDKKYIEGLNGVTAEDVRRVAAQYLRDPGLSVVVLKPLSSGPKESAQEVSAKPALIEKVVLDNGLTVLLKEDHGLPLVSVSLVMNGGLRLEDVKKNGLSELMARLWTRETKLRAPLQLAQEVESLGASFGGFSGQNSVGMRFELLSSDLEYGLDLLEDVFKNPVFSEGELLKEKERMKVGIIARDDDISSVALRGAKETLFLEHYFRLDGLGTLDSVEQIGREDLFRFYKELAVPNNVVLSVFGDFDSKKILEILKKKFAAMKPREIRLPSGSEPVPGTTREKTIDLDKEQAMVIIGFQGPAMADPDSHGMKIIASVMGSALSGRMFNKIRDELGLAYTLGAGYSPGIDTGFVFFY
ncbi:MAG: pitrilysin family protein, partial [Candidatus Omnitrophota bacterium]